MKGLKIKAASGTYSLLCDLLNENGEGLQLIRKVARKVGLFFGLWPQALPPSTGEYLDSAPVMKLLPQQPIHHYSRKWLGNHSPKSFAGIGSQFLFCSSLSGGRSFYEYQRS